MSKTVGFQMPHTRKVASLTVLFVAASGALALSSCSTDQVAATAPPIEVRTAREVDYQQRRARAAEIGRFHTRALAFVRKDIAHASRDKKLTFDEAMGLAEESCNRFMNSEGKSYRCVLPRYVDGISSQVNLSPGSLPHVRSDLSQAAIDYLTSMQWAADNATSTAGFASAAAAISYDASWYLTGADLDAVLGAEAIGNSSFEYWEEDGPYFVSDYIINNNYDQAHIETAYNRQAAPMLGPRISATIVPGRIPEVRYGWFKWKQVAAMDVGGCIAAALVSAGALCGEGAVAGSVADAVAQILLKVI